MFLLKHQDIRFKSDLNGEGKVYLQYTDWSLFVQY